MNPIATAMSRGWLAVRRFFGAGDDFISVEAARHPSVGQSRIGDGLGTNVIMSPIQFVQRAGASAEFVIEERKGRLWRYAVTPPNDSLGAIRLLNQPNDHYDGGTLNDAMTLSWFLDGNAYIRKIRSAMGRVVQLWYMPHYTVEPKWPHDGSEFVSHYEYTPMQGFGKVELDPRDVIHLRVGLDPKNPRKGLSPLKAVLREVLTDEEASKFSAYILHNMGVPGGVIAPKDMAALPSEADVQEMKEFMQQQFTGKRRGEWLVLKKPTTVEQFGFDPGRMMLGPLRDISEERVCAAIGVPAAVVGFGAGLQQTKVGATMRELVRLARVNCIEPNQTKQAKQITRQLLPDFVPDPTGYRIAYDNSNVPLFAEDETERAKRATTLVEGGVMRIDQAQEMVGMEADATQRVYLRPNTHVAVAPGEEPEPEGDGDGPANRLAGLKATNSRGSQ